MVARFAVTLFVSATLLFACQPMIARMIVPLLGGAPAVWILCSLCFQALVLCGYSYAHVVGSRARLRTQVLLQLALVASAFLVMPVVVDQQLVASLTAKSRSLGLLVVLLRSVGLPFFVLATTSPLIQRWYAELGETDPYHLYAASNAGSILALLGYPFAIDPFLSLKQQSRILQVAFAGYGVLILVCAITALRKRHAPRAELAVAPAAASTSRTSRTSAEVDAMPSPESEHAARGTQPVWRERLVWLALAFAPSSLLLGATEFITTDLASVPLLWVVPLALYLASFIVAFAKKQVIKPQTTSRILVFVSAIVAISKVAEIHGPAWLIVGLHITLLFVASVVCHRALALRRPHHSRLTEFYLLLSLGGVLGGAFNGLVAPVVFNDLLEYPIAIALVCLGRTAIDELTGDTGAARKRDVLFGLALAAVTFGLVKLGEHVGSGPKINVLWMYVLPVLVAFAWSKRPIRYAVALGGILLVSTNHGGLTGDNVHKERGFFGVLKVRRDPTQRFLLLLSGSTLHGAQHVDPASKRIPLTYYFPTGPVGDVLGPLPTLGADSRSPRRVGVIGLGVGSLAAYARPADTWTFFELNPRVVALAKTYFTYLSDVPEGTRVDIETGDARLRLAEGASGRFDVLVLDAFSSDAIPLHLMTREAIAIYRRSLRPGGVLLAHISNRHVLLEPVLAALADDAHMVAIGRDELNVQSGEREAEKSSSHWVCLSDTWEPLESILPKNTEWRRLQRDPGQKVWTDDFANVLAAMHL